MRTEELILQVLLLRAPRLVADQPWNEFLWKAKTDLSRFSHGCCFSLNFALSSNCAQIKCVNRDTHLCCKQSFCVMEQINKDCAATFISRHCSDSFLPSITWTCDI